MHYKGSAIHVSAPYHEVQQHVLPIISTYFQPNHLSLITALLPMFHRKIETDSTKRATIPLLAEKRNVLNVIDVKCAMAPKTMSLSDSSERSLWQRVFIFGIFTWITAGALARSTPGTWLSCITEEQEGVADSISGKSRHR